MREVDKLQAQDQERIAELQEENAAIAQLIQASEAAAAEALCSLQREADSQQHSSHVSTTDAKRAAEALGANGTSVYSSPIISSSLVGS